MTQYDYKRLAGFAFGVIAVGMILVWYLGGVCWRYESYDVYQDNPFSQSRYGVSMGPKRFYLRKGQTLVLSYSATIKQGYVHFHFAKPLQPISKLGEGKLNKVTASGSGEIRYPIHESGFYRVSTWTHRDRDLCELSYSATWSAH